ncbi:MAG: GNAT family N-acetyltransferase [Planctomycetota bacterium]
MPIIIEELGPDQWQRYRAVRLAALADSPDFFGSAHADEAAFDETRWRDRLRRRVPTLVAHDTGVDCGLAGGEPDDTQPKRIAWLVSMWVSPSHRRHGIGRRLIEAVISWAEQREFEELRLHVTEGNDPARLLYQNLGFDMTGSSEPHPRVPSLRELEMCRPLKLSR